tara:strand:- start:428 stop:640 length:213 start_codon:yes stop_codon:yes gene_type:complete
MNTITVTEYEQALASTKLFGSMRVARFEGFSNTYQDKTGVQITTQVDTSEFEYVQCTIDNESVVTYQGSK